jgi:hypothetical protein
MYLVVQSTHCQELGNEVTGDSAHTLSGVRAQSDSWFSPHIVWSWHKVLVVQTTHCLELGQI